MLTVSTLKPEYSRMGPAIGLLVLNYLQLANILALSITIFIANFYRLSCLTRTDPSIVNSHV